MVVVIWMLWNAGTRTWACLLGGGRGQAKRHGVRVNCQQMRVWSVHIALATTKHGAQERYHHSAAWPAASQLWGLSSALFSGRHAITACRHDVSGCPSGPLRPLIIISCHPFRITGLHCDSPKLTSPLSVVCNLVPLLMGSQLCFHCFLHRDI